MTHRIKKTRLIWNNVLIGKVIIFLLILNFALNGTVAEAMQITLKCRHCSPLRSRMSHTLATMDKKTSIPSGFTKPFEPLSLDKLNWYSEMDIPKEIPLLDLTNMSRKEQMDCFKKTSEGSNCLYVKNYNIENQDVEDLINVTREFFNQTEDRKLKCRHPFRGIMRGYGAYQQESSEKLFEVHNSGKGDSHVNFSWGPCDNVYLDLNFKKIWKNYFDKSCYMAKILSELAIDSLEMGDILNWEHIKHGDHVLKIQEFIADSKETSQPYRMVPHTDTSFVTILNQIPADNGYMGLEVKIGDKG